MKTKIIYISGSEVFDMADIRAAFDEVRAALALDKQTILFGVPVDNDDAFATTNKTNDITEDSSKYIFDDTQDTTPSPDASVPQEPEIPETVTEPEPVPEEKPVEKPKRATRRTTAKVVPITSAKSDVADTASDNTEKPEIPILSVLGAKTNDDIVNIQPDVAEPIDTPINITPVEPAAHQDNTSRNGITDSDAQPVSINDMLADESEPVTGGEKTLEELLESMTPLGEDEKEDVQPIASPEIDITPEPVPSEKNENDTDATLELLAAEFAESEDKIVAPTKTETRGKIGKLKNILPFKKAKRDDSGIMGDLFGWAGVANDEDFTIPGFFANASSKK